MTPAATTSLITLRVATPNRFAAAWMQMTLHVTLKDAARSAGVDYNPGIARNFDLPAHAAPHTTSAKVFV